MQIALWIVWINIFFWLLPPFRQYKERYFSFFLVVSLTDPINFLIGYFFHISVMPLMFIGWLVFILKKNNTKKFKYLFILIFLSLLIISIYGSVQLGQFFILVICLTILIIFLKRLISNFSDGYILDGFLLVLVFYSITLVLKIILLNLDISNKLEITALTTFFEILFAIFFTVFKQSNPKLQIKLVKDSELE